MDIQLRLEKEQDHYRVEEVTREAFWNVYQPGCEEHLLLHELRKKSMFIDKLDYVAIHNNIIVGSIIYMETRLYEVEGYEHRVLTFGPISVLPEYQNKGIESKLINHTISLAKEMGYKAIVILGDPKYYKRFGFKPSKEYQITNSEGLYPAAMLILELYPKALQKLKGGTYDYEIYNINYLHSDLEEFDKQFPPKEKEHTPSQDNFREIASKFL